jgi:hypothetical protein
MSQPGWDTTLVAPARTLDGQTTQVVTGHMRLDGSTEIVMRAGDNGPTVVLLPQAARELTANLNTLMGGES